MFLEKALESILAQDYRDFEVLVIDDGSTTPEAEMIVDRMQERFGQRIQYIYQENQGLSAARNRGLAKANGEFIAFLDADDFYEGCKLSLQLRLLENLGQDYAFVSGGVRHFTDGNPSKAKTHLPPLINGDVYLRLLYRKVNILLNPAGHLFRSTHLEEVSGFDEGLWNHEDADLLIRLARKYKVKAHQHVVYWRRLHWGSLSNANPQKVLDNPSCHLQGRGKNWMLQARINNTTFSSTPPAVVA